MSDNDRLRRFLFERWPVRGQFVRLDAAWRAVIEHHDYPPVLTRCLGEAVAATVLVAGTLKFKGRLLMQCQGPGPVHLIVAECTDRHAIRGLLRHRGELPADASLAALTGGGQLAMTRFAERRIRVGRLKADQVRATGAKVLATPCHNCIDQFMELNKHYNLGLEIKTVCEIVADAIVL